jgi:hypothetical protein
MNRVPTLSLPLEEKGGLVLSDSEKAEALAASLEAQFKMTDVPSNSAVIQMANEGMRAYQYVPEENRNEPIPRRSYRPSGDRVGKPPGPKVTPNRILRFYLSTR